MTRSPLRARPAERPARPRETPEKPTQERHTGSEPSGAIVKRFFGVYVKALQGHQTPLRPRQTVESITVATCDLAELTYLRELRQAVIDAGRPPVIGGPA